MNKLIVLIAMTFAIQSFAGIGEIETDSSGKPLVLNFADANKYCESHGLRLPTVFEYCAYGQAHGANGLIPSKYPGVSFTNSDKDMERKALRAYNPSKVYYYPVYFMTDMADFYYSSFGYKQPEGEYTELRSWSSSDYTVYAPYIGEQHLVHTFDGQNGAATTWEYLDSVLPVRCYTEIEQ